jgi:hypothetical protein
VKKFVIAAAGSIVLAAATLTGCSSDADVVSNNIAKESEQFNIVRRIVFVNGITDKYLLEIEGRCSFNDDGSKIEVTCKAAGGEYKKHILGRSDNVTYVIEQLDSANVSADHYKLIFKPETIVPDVDRK